MLKLTKTMQLYTPIILGLVLQILGPFGWDDFRRDGKGGEKSGKKIVFWCVQLKEKNENENQWG